MANDVKYEIELYEPMRLWFGRYLTGKYAGWSVHTVDSHARTLDIVLEEYGVIDSYPQVVGLDIQIDVLGIMTRGGKASIAFIEAKKNPLTLHDLGQLLVYCRLCDPAEAFLLSSRSMGSLNKIVNNLHREDLLDYGNGKAVKKMFVGKWDVGRNAVDFATLVPKI